jgi:phosphoglycerate dehydrogenase-like enzyme
MNKILITSLEYNKAKTVFENCRDFECISAPDDEPGLAAAVRAHQAKYIIIGVTKYQQELYEALPRGGVIARFGVGHDGVDKILAKNKGIYCTNTPGALDDSVAECAMGMIMLAARRFAECAADNRAGTWKNRVGIELAGKTLAVIGCGNIGRKLAKIAKLGFNMTVIGHDIAKPQNLDNFDRFESDFATTVQNADFVSLHIPDIPATKNFINRERLALFKKSVWLINTARGGVVDEDAVYDAAKQGTIGGAVLDVFKREPYAPETNDLRALDNIIMTPHIGSSTIEACERMALSAIANIRHCTTGKIETMNHLYQI